MVDFIEASPLSPKSTGFNEFSSNIATALVCLATNRTYNFSKMIFDGLVKNVNNKGEGSGTPTEPQHTPSLEAQSPSHTTHTSPTLPPVTTTSLPTVTQSDTPIDKATIDKSFTLPHDSAPRVTSPVADEGSMQQTIPKLTALCTSLQRQLSELTAKFQAQEGRSIDEGEAATERISDDSEKMAIVLTSMDAATVLASGVVDVPTGSGSIPTASTHAEEQVPTVFATMVTPYRRRKGKEVMVESETLKKQKVQEQIDAEVTRELEEQLEREDHRRF
nr:hypothetical protein [Tanacetum cinerariifolium]